MSLRAAQVRFYVDADILGLGKILGALRNDVTYPGDPGAVLHKRHWAPCPIASPDVLDTDWIPDVAGRGWLIVTRDSMILQNRNEIAAIRENNAKMVALNQRDAQTKWGQLEVFMTQWRHIEALTGERGPFIWRVSRTAPNVMWNIAFRYLRYISCAVMSPAWHLALAGAARSFGYGRFSRCLRAPHRRWPMPPLTRDSLATTRT